MSIVSILGKYSSIVIGLYIMLYALYKSIKRKQIIWIIILILNTFLGYYIPMYLAVMLPLIYLVKYKDLEKKNIKKQKIKLWGFILIGLSIFFSFGILVMIDKNHAIEVIITSFLIGYIVKLALNNKIKRKIIYT